MEALSSVQILSGRRRLCTGIRPRGESPTWEKGLTALRLSA